MKILFVLPRMVTGGVERITLRLIKELQQRGHECAFALRKAHGEFLPEAEALCPVYEIANKSLYQFIPNLSKLIHTWQPTHIVTAFSDIGFLTFLAIKHSGQNLYWLHSVHGPHDIITARPTFIGHLRFELDKLFATIVYKKTNKIIAVSNGVRQDILKQFKCAKTKVVTIYNPVLDKSHFIPKPSTPPNSPKKIIALGRLTRQKGFDLLIQAMHKVPQPWHLEIWGDGEEKQNLQKLIDSLDLNTHITLKGNTNQPFNILRQADLFVLSSRFEGLPTVLIEAICCQCNIISTNCPHGAAEILEEGRWGMLVKNENIEALTQAIIEKLNNYKSISPELLLNRAFDFSIEKAVDEWEKLFKKNKED
ncbi:MULTISPECIES: glycosyltransferase [unclassified Acinetobacter]|uniref:glycosyltransferase n=1 Tax=unclassified Acinetobacter TaxID=196816 RepID=UPI00257570A4|nr:MULTISPECIES: glycosyltransferase [unclassified Acinetobacter]MDM1764119.1 glycosyltransferase [Acinetobacter sp. 226-1]MDM1769050.1 glycosyltransferase [Acinetobacter sp. 226-4]